MVRTFTAMLIAALAAAPSAAAAQECAAPGSFVPTRTMTYPRGGHAAPLLTDGRVMLAGSDDRLRHVEIFDPVSQTLAPTGEMNVGRCYGCGVERLADGRILLVGGWEGGPVLTSAELWDPATGSWAFTGSMRDNRLGPNVHKLPDGRILAFSGHTGFTGRDSAEIYDPATEQWTVTGSLSLPRLGVSVTLTDGRILVTGGLASTGAYLQSAEIYHPATGAWTATGSMSDARHGHGAVVMADGRVLVFGGMAVSQQHGFEALRSAEIYDPATGTFTVVGSMTVARTGAAAMSLPDGRVLVAGGLPVLFNPVSSTEIFDPATGTFSPGPSMHQPRWSFALTPLSDGRFLLSGGYGQNNGKLNSMEFFAPCAVADTTPPTIDVPEPIEIEATSVSGAAVAFTASAVDDTDGPVAVVCTPPSGSTFPLGTSTVTCSAEDAAGNTASASFTVRVIDTTAPAIERVSSSVPVLWAPNHRMVDVQISITGVDLADAAPACRVVSVTSSQAANAPGDGNTRVDAVITGPTSVQLRAERTKGQDRTYTIGVECQDASGNVARDSTTVVVQNPLGR